MITIYYRNLKAEKYSNLQDAIKAIAEKAECHPGDVHVTGNGELVEFRIAGRRLRTPFALSTKI